MATAVGVLAALAASAALVSCASEPRIAPDSATEPAIDAVTTAPTAPTDPVVPSAQPGAAVGPFHPEVGECLDARKDASSGTESIVPCDEAHDDEVYATFALDGSRYPGEAAAEAIANDGCRARFSDFIGVALEDSVFEFVAMYPSAENWDQHGDRTVTCLVWYPEDTVTGSLEGVAY